MARKIEGIVYDDKIADIMRDRALLTVLTKHVEDTRPAKNMLQFLTNPPKPAEVYDLYLAPSARYPFPVSRTIGSQIQQIVNGDDQNDAAAWSGIIRSTTSFLERVFDEKLLPAFFKGKRFRAFHDDRARTSAKKKLPSAKKMADQLGTRNVGMVEELMVAVNLGRDSEADRIARQLIQSERLDVDRKKLLGALRKGRIPADGLGPDRVDVTTQKLRLCGFEKAGDSKLQQAVQEFAQACLARDRITIRIAYKKIRRIEPGQKGVRDQAASNELIAMMRRHKVF